MSELEKKLNSAIASNDLSNWAALREAIHDAHGIARSTEERVELLQLYKQLMDHVATTQIASGNLSQFNESRAKDYRLLLVQEGLIGDNACIETLDEVTRREIAADRMASDDELRQVIEERLANPHPSRAQLEALAEQPTKSFWTRLFGKR